MFPAPSTRIPPPFRSGFRRAVTIAVLTLAPFAQAPGQDMEVPVRVQVQLFRKVLSFDRQLDVRARGELVIAVAYQGKNRESADTKDAVVRAIAGLPAAADGARVRAIAVDLDRETLAHALSEHRPDAIYVAPLRAVDIADVAASARAARVTTLTGVPEYIAAGLAISMRLLDQRPKLLLNVTAAAAEGADFSSDLLRLAVVTR